MRVGMYIIICIALWVLYHKIFNVYYFDLGRGCFGEILGCMVIGVFLYGLIGMFLEKFWFVLVIIGIVVIIALIKKNGGN